MPSSSVSFRDSKSSKQDIWEINIPESFGNKGATIQLITDCWSLCDNDDGMDYFLLVTGQDPGGASLAYGLNPTLYVDKFMLSNFIVNNEKVLTQKDGVVLLANSPDTTRSSTSFTSGTTETLSSSAGFSGGDLQGSIGYSVSTENSQTRSIDDVTIINRCLLQSGNDGTWVYEVAENSNTQKGNLQICQQMLFKVPHALAAGGISLNIVLGIDLSDHDGKHGTHYWDDYFNGAGAYVRANGAELSFQPGEDRSGHIQFKPHFIELPVPHPLAKS